jgi:hypothetical protein
MQSQEQVPPLVQDQRQAIQKTRARTFAVMVFLMEVGLMFAYGFGAQFNNVAQTGNDNADSLILYILVALLAILGWGLIIAYS